MPTPFSAAFLAGDPRALGLLPLDFRDPEARIRHAKEVSKRSLSPELFEIVKAQNSALSASAARSRNIAALREKGTAVVVTGQQVGLFLGPLYTLYKAASAIVCARAIEAESGVRTVPLFWLQTEDHDYPEIDHCFVARPHAPPLRLALSDGGGEAAKRSCVAYRVLGDELPALFNDLEEALGDLPHRDEVLELFRAHYRAGNTLPLAFGGVVAELFAEEGLIVFDPRTPSVAALAAPMIERSIVECDAIAETLAKRASDLTAADFDTQVHVRPCSPLPFLHEGTREGPRYRFERCEAGWSSIGSETKYSSGEPLQILARDPSRFSTSALLRPILQDALFPTVAYVGGPGELNYFAQLPPLHRRFDLPPPLFIPRARFRAIDSRTRNLLTELHLSAADVEQPAENLLRKLGAQIPKGMPNPDQLEKELLKDFLIHLETFETEAKRLDQLLADPVKRTRATVARAVSRLRRRYERNLAQKDVVTSARIERLQNELFPNSTPQERVYSMLSLAARVGAKRLKESVLAAVRPFDAAILELPL